jgi:hypothetical protein
MAGPPSGHAVEAHRVGEVLRRGHLLEEARLDRDAVHQLLDLVGLRDHVVVEDPGDSAVGDQQRGEDADQRRLTRPVLAEHGDRLATAHREAHLVERGDMSVRRGRTITPDAARRLPYERLRELHDLDRRDRDCVLAGRQEGVVRQGHR